MSSDHDQTVERLLRRSLRAQGEPAPATDDACLDAETFAAWIDGGLSATHVSLVESHLAQCGRCQAMAAAIGRSVPPVQAAERWWQRRWTLGWLVPLTASVAAIALWIAVPRETSKVARSDASAVEMPQLARETEPSARLAAPADRVQAPPQIATNDQQRLDARGSLNPKAGTAAFDRREVREEAAQKSSDALGRLADSAPPPVQELPAPVAASAPPIEAAAPRAAAGTTAPAAPPAAAPAADSTASNRAFAARQAAAVAVIDSPDPMIRWRLGIPGIVQRSGDGGASWDDFPSGVSTDLTIGTAPSASVAWIVGRRGTVVRTTDGRRWQQIPFPYDVDLTAVQASDARSATITAADGRRFTTTDGGNSWTPSPLQEF